MGKDLKKIAVGVINCYAPELNISENDIDSVEGYVEETVEGDITYGVRSITIYPNKNGKEKFDNGKREGKEGLRPVDPDSLFAKLTRRIHGED